jgi:AcrR family transcriptional regulator
VADAGGLSRVTMRSVAAQVGVTAMALYPHVRDKETLLDGVVDHLLAELNLQTLSGPWQDRLDALGHQIYRLVLRHPGSAPLLFTRPIITERALQVVDAMYGILLDAGTPLEEVPRLERLISTAIVGFAVSQVSGRFDSGSVSSASRRGLLPPELLPAHERLAHWLDRPVNWSDEFDANLDDLTALVFYSADGGRATTTGSGKRHHDRPVGQPGTESEQQSEVTAARLVVGEHALDGERN